MCSPSRCKQAFQDLDAPIRRRAWLHSGQEDKGADQPIRVDPPIGSEDRHTMPPVTCPAA